MTSGLFISWQLCHIIFNGGGNHQILHQSKEFRLRCKMYPDNPVWSTQTRPSSLCSKYVNMLSIPTVYPLFLANYFIFSACLLISWLVMKMYFFNSKHKFYFFSWATLLSKYTLATAKVTPGVHVPLVGNHCTTVWNAMQNYVLHTVILLFILCFCFIFWRPLHASSIYMAQLVYASHFRNNSYVNHMFCL